ncbi:MAG: hypothetical protein JW910_02100 [Anaerolineae bacterium]|nr:hypothetical protein [Anaerolineae bacterium]
MSHPIDLKALERRAWLSNFTDGMWDIFLGLLLLNWAILALLSSSGLDKGWQYVVGIGFMLFAAAILWAGKRFITVPRLGRVRMRAEATIGAHRANRVFAGALIAGIVCLLIVLLLAAQGIAEPDVDLSVFVFPLAFALGLLILFGLGAYFLQFGRLFLIGVLYALTVPVDTALSEFYGIEADYLVFAVAAGFILLMGGVLLARFLQAHPLPEQE